MSLSSTGSPRARADASQTIAPPQAAHAAFEPHAFEKTFVVPKPRGNVWSWLEDPATFTDSQIWPYRVEFVSADANPPGFYEGGLNIHHGPLLHLPAMLTEIRDGSYRDLHYFYGSYVLSPRLVRPTRLRFWVEDDTEARGTRVRLQLDSFVRRGFVGAWSLGQRIFWSA